ncbi:hypothetical protein CCHL11_04461 [Colletotrichum chlorophyti]|uniref:BZIP domain-containing protein n=1 Tax=Colletotrichum chlorophyti TaxID=708187 RepID=A0A1Q8S4H6_9PEZI|nr:hypothetical protein CCHL11_04461 [Colletotrichum chlorophyti]
MDVCFSSGTTIPPNTTIPVQTNPRLAEMRDPSEDWTGVTSTAERRKLQNRLNQRARRRRNQLLKKAASASTSPDPTSGRSAEASSSTAVVKLENPALFDAHSPSVATQRSNTRPFLCFLAGNDEEIQRMLDQCAEKAYEDYIFGNPCSSSLTTLVRVNVFHAFVRNAQVLNFDNEWLTYDAISPFNKMGPGLGDVVVSPSCPENMRPTPLQLFVKHHPWIDFFPSPIMRDNFLRVVAEKGEDYIDEDDMCRDIVDIGAGAGVDEAALIVWGEPWDPRGWEATEPFLRKWGWLLYGCTDMLEGTNYWRERRGLRRLRFV